MQAYQETLQASFKHAHQQPSLLSVFFNWCENQEQFRFGWLAVIIAVHGCILAPITALLVATTGNNIGLWCMATGAMAISLTSNLAAMPTKITIPVFFISIVMDLVVIGLCLKALI